MCLKIRGRAIRPVPRRDASAGKDGGRTVRLSPVGPPDGRGPDTEGDVLARGYGGLADRRSGAWPLRGAQRRGNPRPRAQTPWTRCRAYTRAGRKARELVKTAGRMKHGQLTEDWSKGKRCTSWEPLAQHSAHRPRTPTGAAKASRQHSGTSRCQLTFNPHWRTSIVTESAARRRTAEERLTRWEKVHQLGAYGPARVRTGRDSARVQTEALTADAPAATRRT